MRDRHPDPTLNGLNWQAVHDSNGRGSRTPGQWTKSAHPDRDAREAQSVALCDHSERSVSAAGRYGRFPASSPDATPGFTPIVIEGKAVVGSVDPDSPAARAGIHPGMVLDGIDGAKVATILRLADNVKDQESHRIVEQSVTRKLDGPAEQPVHLDVIDEQGRPKHIELDRHRPKASWCSFGNLPETRFSSNPALWPTAPATSGSTNFSIPCRSCRIRSGAERVRQIARRDSRSTRESRRHRRHGHGDRRILHRQGRARSWAK